MKRRATGAVIACLVLTALAACLFALRSGSERQAAEAALAAANGQVDDLLARLARCEGQLDCERVTAEIDYTSNATVSESLKRHVEETRGSVDTADWEVIWSDSKTAIHRLRGKYLYVFLVWFDEPELGIHAGTLDLNQVCFIDRPEASRGR